MGRPRSGVARRPTVQIHRPPATLHRVVLGDSTVVGRHQRHRGVEMIRLVSAAMCASSVVGDEEKNGGLWCSPIADTSSLYLIGAWAIRSIAWICSASFGALRVTGFRVMFGSTRRFPNCINHQLSSVCSTIAG